MDHALVKFQRAAARENRGRRGLRRRYSAALQDQAVEYWQQRQRAGDGVRVVAAALGVAHWSLHRWIQARRPRRFHGVQIMPAAPGRPVRAWSSGSPARAHAAKDWMWRQRPSCWHWCDEMARTARDGVRVRAAYGYAEGV
jgi:hypothetical protein